MKKTKPRAAELRPPSHLSSDTAKIWRGVVTHLRSNGHLLTVDVGVIETYCMAVTRQRQLTREIDKAGLIGKDGKPHPFLRTIEATAGTIRNLSHVLGLSPLARKALPARVKQPRMNDGHKGADPWQGVLEE